MPAKNNPFINAFVDRIDEPSKTVIAVYGGINSETDEVKYDELHFPLNDFAEPPMEGDCIAVYADSLELVVVNIGKNVFCEVEYLISGGTETIYKKVFKEALKLSGVYGDKNDAIRLIKLRKKIWKKCLAEKEYLQSEHKDCNIFIKRSSYWTDSFAYKEIFTGYIKHIGYKQGQNYYMNDSDPENVPNDF